MLRIFRRDRGFHALVVLLLGLGIGANALVFSLVNELLLKPLPVRDPKNLYLLQRIPSNFVRPDPYFQEQHLSQAVSKSPAVAAYVAEQGIDSAALVPMRAGDRVRLISAQIVSPNYFQELGVRPRLGRLLDASDASPGATLPAVISDRFWQSEYRGDPSAIGRTIRLKDQAFTIAGVLPPEFHSVDIDRSPDVRLPVSAASLFGGMNKVAFFVLVRLAPGVGPQQAATALYPAIRAIEDPHYAKQDSFTLALAPMARGVSRMRDQFAGALWALLGGVALLLCAVCANVGGLLVAKSGERRREFGIRAALGAGRGRILRQILMENLSLAVAGALVGAALAWLLAPEVVSLLPPVRDWGQLASPQLLSVRPDWRLLLFVATATSFCVLASGLVPAWRASRVDLMEQMHRYSRTGRVLPVAIQAAFSIVLLSAAGLMLRSYRNLDRLDAGFDREHIVEFTFDLSGGSAERTARFTRDLQAQASALPSVRAAAWSNLGVMRGSGMKTTVAPQGVVLPRSTFLNTSMHAVTPEYFDAMGLPILSGRGLRISDIGVKPAPVVVNQALAKTLYPRQDPIGRSMVQGRDGTLAPTHVIVGVVPTAKYRSMREPDPPTFYAAVDLAQRDFGQVTLYVRTHGSPSAVAGPVRQAAASLDPSVPLMEAVTLDSEVRTSLWQERLVAVLSAFFGLASVGLAALGLYGALSLSVSQRRRELGIRVAVGARTPDVARTVCGSMAAGIGIGAAAGLGAGYWLLRLTRSLLFGVSPFDGPAIAISAATLAAVSILAAALPTRRAARIDPAAALREE